MNEAEENQLLARALESLGAMGGAGGGAGARWGARLLRKSVHTTEFAAAMDPTTAIAHAARSLEREGQLVSVDQRPDGGAVVRAVLGAGTWNMNPAVVTITITPTAPEPTPSTVQVHIRSAAKEGLIKQHTARKAAERVTAHWH